MTESPFSAADLQQMLELSDALLVVIDLQGTVKRISSTWTTLLGWPMEALLGHHYSTFMHPDDVEPMRERFRARLAGALMTGETVNRFRTSAGDYRWFQWAVRADPANDQAWFLARDITEQRASTLQRELVAELGRTALEGAAVDDVLQLAVDALATGLSMPYAYAMERQGDELALRAFHGLAETAREMTPIPVDESTACGLAALTGTSQVLAAMTALPDKQVHGMEGETYGALAVLVGTPDRSWGVLGTRNRRPHDFTEQDLRFAEQLAHLVAVALDAQQMQESLRHLATHDGLTGLPNRDLLRERVHAGLAAARATGRSVGLLLCDLDQFKDVNDSLGHLAGDAVLQQLADRLVQCVDGQGTVARLGGDEFAIFVAGPQTALEVLGVADTVVEAMHKPFVVPGMEISLSTSIGIAMGPSHGRDAATLLRHADVAMYRAKSARLGWALYDPALDTATTERLALTADLRRAIDSGQLTLEYQPVVELRTGEVASVEALCRWHHPDRGRVDPLTFITLAEQTGNILPLTRWVVAEAVAQCRAWREQGLELRCAVNLSIAAIRDRDAAAPLLRDLIDAADLLSVEVTESWLVDEQAQRVLTQLATGGVALAIDDFGTGYSSLASLRSFPTETLKLDRTFLADLDGDLLSAVGALGQALGLTTVAEGVEDQVTADRLLAAGMQLGQGFLWSRALPPDQLVAWLATRTDR